MSRNRGENRAWKWLVGLRGCGPVKSAAPLPTSHTKKNAAENARRNCRCRLRLADSNFEVDTETADFNVFFVVAEAETRRCEDGLTFTSQDSQRSPSLIKHWSLKLLSALRTKASQILSNALPNGH